MPDHLDTKELRPRSIRSLLEGLGIALLMVVLLKHFVVEAYRIPTSSMQPTVMGSASAGVYDRLIVDKFCYSVVEPKRWDIAVFKYPLRESRNYLKRIVGVGGRDGERLRIAGGNVYSVLDDEDGSEAGHLRILRKPPQVQAGLWKNVFPARMHLDGDRTILGRQFEGSGDGDWTEDEDALLFAPSGASSRATLTYDRDGLPNDIWDGYPPDVARAIRDHAPHSLQWQQVQDARLAFALTPSARPDRLSIGIDIARSSTSRARFAFRWEAGKGRLEITADDRVAISTEPFDLAIDGGSTRRFRLAHCDDLLTLEIDGRETARLECRGHEILQEPERVTLISNVDGGGELRFTDLVVERDLHYLASCHAAVGPNRFMASMRDPGGVIRVPPDHFFMLGDNTLESVDSRDWTEITIGVLDGRIVDPDERPEARLLSGDLRPTRLDREPELDENPIPVTSRDRIVFTDRAGEVRVLEGQVSSANAADDRVWGQDGAWLRDETGRVWHPSTAPARFVPREHVIGRPLLRFWPLLNPFRFGLVK